MAALALDRIFDSFQQEAEERDQALMQAFPQGHAELVTLNLLVI